MDGASQVMGSKGRCNLPRHVWSLTSGQASPLSIVSLPPSIADSEWSKRARGVCFAHSMYSHVLPVQILPDWLCLVGGISDAPCNPSCSPQGRAMCQSCWGEWGSAVYWGVKKAPTQNKLWKLPNVFNSNVGSKKGALFIKAQLSARKQTPTSWPSY